MIRGAALLAAAFVVSFGAQSVLPRPPDHIARVQRWLAAVVRHHVGTLDDSAMEVESWSDAQLSVLFTDLRALTVIMRKPDQRVMWVPPRSRTSVPLFAEPEQQRMKVLACAAGGIALTDFHCTKDKVSRMFDADLRELERLAVDGRGAGADNFVLKYGALLETDIAILAPASSSPMTLPPNGGAQRFRVEMSDGQATGIHQSAVHWEIARMLLDAVRTTRGAEPAPARDSMVRDWYVATAQWMQFNVHYDSNHLNHARGLFPNDRDILFLAGTQHAIYATPRIQGAVRSVVLPSGYSMDARSDGEELRQARTLLRRALEVDPSFGEAHLRLGRVLALDGQFADAERELTAAETAAPDEPNRYYAALFLGSVEEALGRFDEARAAYDRAAELFPLAQSPLVGIAELARRRGDRSTALRTMQEVFALPPEADERKDPWWIYDIWQARDADDRLAAIRQPFGGDTP